MCEIESQHNEQSGGSGVPTPLATLFFYGFFIALATILAEVFTYNYPEVLLSFWGYLTYGLLYILFINVLVRRRVADWNTVYLLGVLVGFITEGYAAKVVFFGWDADSFTFHGFAVAETLFLSFVFHPLFSFMLPVFLARNFFNFPFAVPKTKHPYQALCVLIPFYVLIMGATTGRDVFSLAAHLVPTLFIMSAWAIALRKWGCAGSITLGKGTSVSILAITVAFFTFTFHFMETAYTGVIMLPSQSSVVLSLVFVGFVSILVALRIKDSENTEAAYSPDFPLGKSIAYFALLTMLLLIAPLNPAAHLLLSLYGILFIGGIVAGPAWFIYVIVDTVRRLLSQTPPTKVGIDGSV